MAINSVLQDMANSQANALSGYANTQPQYKEKVFQVGSNVLFRWYSAVCSAFQEGIILKRAGEMYLIESKGWLLTRKRWVDGYSIKGVIDESEAKSE